MAPFHVIDIDEAWAFAGYDTQRWTLSTGQRVLLPVWESDMMLAPRTRRHDEAAARFARGTG